VRPVPVVAAECVVFKPAGQQHIAQIRPAVIASFDEGVVRAGVADADQLVEQSQQHHDSAGLLVFPEHILGVGVSVPGRQAGFAAAFSGQQVRPSFGGVKPFLVAGDLVTSDQAKPEKRDEIELDHALRIALTVRITLVGDADQESGPGMVLVRLAVVQEYVGDHADMGNRGRVTGVAVVIHPAEHGVGSALGEIAVAPVLEVAGANGAVRLDLPSAVVDVVRRGQPRLRRRRPRISLQCFGGHANAEVTLPVETLVPRGDDAVPVLDGVMCEVSRLRSLSQGRGRQRETEQEGHERQTLLGCVLQTVHSAISSVLDPRPRAGYSPPR